MRKILLLFLLSVVMVSSAESLLIIEPNSSSFVVSQNEAGYGSLSITNTESYLIDSLSLSMNMSSIDGDRINNFSFGANIPFFISAGWQKNISFVFNPGFIKEGDYSGYFVLSNGSNLFTSSIIRVRVKGDSGPSITDYSPKGVQHSSSVLFSLNTNKKSICRQSFSIKEYSIMNDFDVSYDTTHLKTFQDLGDGIYHVYSICKDIDGRISKIYEANISVSQLPSAQIILNSSILKGGLIKVNLITSKKVMQTPTLSYKLGGESGVAVPLTGSGNSWSGYMFIPQVGNAVGSFYFYAKDFEGNVGEEISSGSVFVVDTVKPLLIASIQSIGYVGNVGLRWYYNEEVDHFNIYRDTSPGVDYTDYYKSTIYKSDTDDSVEKGVTYYYRVSAVDAAGNEGELSKEVYATVLLNNVTQSKNSLAPSLVGSVDRVIGDIDKVVNDAQFISESIVLKEKEVFSLLGFEQKINSAENELGVLKRELESYKGQDLTEIELEKKLNAAQLKISLIRKNIPEQITVVEEKSFDAPIQKEDLDKVLSEVYPDIDDTTKASNLERYNEFIGNNVKVSAKIIMIMYLDGSGKEVTLINKKFKSGNFSLVEYIPKGLVESTDLIEVKSKDYEIIKSDPVIKFDGDEATYVILSKVDLSLVGGSKLVPILELEKKKESVLNSITGYFVFTGQEFNPIFVFGIVIVFFVVIIFVMRMRQKLESEEVAFIEKKLDEAENAMREGKRFFVKGIYADVVRGYNSLKRKSKKKIHPRVNTLSLNYQFREGLDFAQTLVQKGKYGEARKLFGGLGMIYNKLPTTLKSECLEEYEKLRRVLE